MPEGRFDKYRDRGAYHWRDLSRLPWRHQAYTATRYQIVLESAGNVSDKSVLDVGSGDGVVAFLLSRKGAVVTGVEPDDRGRQLASEICAKRGTSVRFVASLDEVEQRSADVAICTEVIEHVDDPDALLDAIGRRVVSGGLVVITTPIRLTEMPGDVEHVQEFFPDEFRDLVAKHFDIVEHRLELPVLGVELYLWRPRMFLRAPVTKWTINILTSWLHIYPLRRIGRADRLPTLQVMVGLVR